MRVASEKIEIAKSQNLLISQLAMFLLAVPCRHAPRSKHPYSAISPWLVLGSHPARDRDVRAAGALGRGECQDGARRGCAGPQGGVELGDAKGAPHSDNAIEQTALLDAGGGRGASGTLPGQGMARLSGLSAREDRVDDHLPRAQAGAAGTAGAANKGHASEPGARAAKMPRVLRADVRFGVEGPPHVPRLSGPRRAHWRRQRHFRPAQQARQRRRAVVSGSRAATGGDGGKHSKNCATE